MNGRCRRDERMSIFVRAKRPRAAVLQDAGALLGDAEEARSVLDCASPLALSMEKTQDAHHQNSVHREVLLVSVLPSKSDNWRCRLERRLSWAWSCVAWVPR